MLAQVVKDLTPITLLLDYVNLPNKFSMMHNKVIEQVHVEKFQKQKYQPVTSIEDGHKH